MEGYDKETFLDQIQKSGLAVDLKEAEECYDRAVELVGKEGLTVDQSITSPVLTSDFVPGLNQSNLENRSEVGPALPASTMGQPPISGTQEDSQIQDLALGQAATSADSSAGGTGFVPLAKADWRQGKGQQRRPRSRSRGRQTTHTRSQTVEPQSLRDARVVIPQSWISKDFDLGFTADGWYEITDSIREKLDSFQSDMDAPLDKHGLTEEYLSALSRLWMNDKWAHLARAKSYNDIAYFVLLMPKFWTNDIRRKAHWIAASNLHYLVHMAEYVPEDLAKVGSYPFSLSAESGINPFEVVGLNGQPLEVKMDTDPLVSNLIDTIGAMTKQLSDRQMCVESKVQELTTSLGKLVSTLQTTNNLLRAGGSTMATPSSGGGGSVRSSVSGVTGNKSANTPQGGKAPPGSASAPGAPQFSTGSSIFGRRK